MSSEFDQADRDTRYLLPPSIEDWLPEDHLARFVVEIVARLDLRPLTRAYSGGGSRAYHPAMLLALLFYGYATGIFASRKLEQATYDSLAFRYITGNYHPDHDTIAAFRKRFLTELKPLFTQILLIARSMGILALGKISLDGTKVKANASKNHALSWEHACALENQLKAEVEDLLRQGEAADRSSIPDGMSIPQELRRREERLVAIARAKEELERRAAERYAREKQDYDRKMAQRTAKEQRRGRKPGGKAPKAPEPGPKPQDQVNLTDADSRIMPAPGGGFVQAYNAQASVDTESMLIVENHLSRHANDQQEITATLTSLAALPGDLGKVTVLLADAGYCSEGNIQRCESAGIQPYIAVRRDHHNQTPRQRFGEPPPLPENADAVAKMSHRLRTQAGKRLYAQRKCTVEPVFGIIKSVLGFRQFLLRTLESVSGEWDLICLAWNLKRMHAFSCSPR